jgi:chromosomal replication initiation ATPase DnaA
MIKFMSVTCPNCNHVFIPFQSKPELINLDKLLADICKEYNVNKTEIESKSRKAMPVKARQMFCYRAREGGHSLQSIANYIHYKTHSNVVYAIKRVQTIAY